MIGKYERMYLKFAFNEKQRMRVYRKLSRFLANSVTLSSALEIMHKHATMDGKKPKAPIARILGEWRRQITNGKSFGQAVQGWIPDSDRLVIEGYESAGSLGMGIEKAVLISSSAKQIKSTLFAGLAYPVMLIVIAILMLVLFGLQVVPTFEEVLPRESWTGVGAQMATMSDFIRDYIIYIIGLMAVLIALTIWSMPRWTGKWRVKFDRYPPWSLYRLVMGAGFMVSVGSMIKSGMAIPSILKLLQRGASPWYVERLSRAAYHVNNGSNLGDALHRAGHNFPDVETVQDLRAYASLTGFDETLDRLGTEWLGESVAKVQQQTGIMRNFGFLFLGVVFGWIAMGMFSLLQQITTSM